MYPLLMVKGSNLLSVNSAITDLAGRNISTLTFRRFITEEEEVECLRVKL